jgi:(p)ppGpp synthase/HD superfamily hydrolase
MSVRIERVVLTNVALEAREADAFRGSVESELARLVEERGVPASAAGNRLVDLHAGATPVDIAHAIYDALGKAD